MLTVRTATSPEEARDAASICWPLMTAGQVTFGLAGYREAEKLVRSWIASIDCPSDVLLLAEDNGELLGACVIDVEDDAVYTRNSPLAVTRHDEVFAAFFARLHELFPGKILSCGTSPANVHLTRFLASRGTVVERSQPLTLSLTRHEPARAQLPVHRVDASEGEQLRELMAPVDDSMYWSSERVLSTLDDWVVVATDDWSAVSTTRRCGSGMAEVFALINPGGSPDVVRALLRGTIGELTQPGDDELVAFLEPGTEALTAIDEGCLLAAPEYCLWQISL